MFLQVGINKIYLTNDEAEAVKKAWISGVKKIMIKGEVVNSEYIVGVFDGDDPDFEPLLDVEKSPNRLIDWQKAKTDWEKVGSILCKMKEKLTEKGVFLKDKKKERYLAACKKQDELKNNGQKTS